MGFKFRKSFKIAPGVRVNFGKKSSSISFGGKGFRTSISTKGRTTTSVGIPGTGLSYSTSSSLKGKTKSKKQVQNRAIANDNHKVNPQYSPRTYKVCGILSMIIAVPVVLLSLLVAIVEPLSLIITAIGIVLFVAGLFMKKASKVIQQEASENNFTSCESQ